MTLSVTKCNKSYLFISKNSLECWLNISSRPKHNYFASFNIYLEV